MVHGAGDRGSVWAPLAAELNRWGWETIAPDLPCDDATAGCAAYAEVAVASLSDVSGDLIVIGHSLAGLTIPIIAEVRSVTRLVFLCALLPEPGVRWSEQFEEEPEMLQPGYGDERIFHADTTYTWPADAALHYFYDDCSPEVAEQAVNRLRPQGTLPTSEVSPLKAWPQVPVSVIVSAEDRALSPRWAARAARTRLGVEAIVLPGGHSPHLARPEELSIVVAGAVGN